MRTSRLHCWAYCVWGWSMSSHARDFPFGWRTLEAFRLIEQGSFQQLIRYCWPSLSEKDIPHCNTLHAEILRHAHLAENTARDKLKVNFQLFALFLSHKYTLFSTFLAKFLSLLMPGHHSLATPTCRSLATTLMHPLIGPMSGSSKWNN